MDLATIWSVVDKLTKKPTLIKPIDINTCHECKTIKIKEIEAICALITGAKSFEQILRYCDWLS